MDDTPRSRARPGDGILANEFRALLTLALPLAAANFGQMLLGAVDTAVVGRLGERELAATGLGNSVFFTLSILGLGLMHGLDPLVSQALGAGEPGLARRTWWQGVWLALVASLPIALLMLLVGTRLELLGIEPQVADQAREYLWTRLPGLVPFLVFGASRSYLQGNQVVWPMVLGAVLANVVNLPLSWLLVFGDAGLVRFGLPGFGVPPLGVAGAGWTSSVSFVLQMVVLLVGVSRIRVEARVSRRPDRALLRRALSLGLPVGVTLFAEIGFFSITNFLMGNIGQRELAAHQVAITLAASTFMIPLGVGAASSVRVGRAVGQADTALARKTGLLSLGVGVGVMALAAAAFLIIPAGLARVITDQALVVKAAVPLLFVAALFQLSDGAQAVAAGALRGAGDTRFTLVANLAGHYLVGLPVGIVLGFNLGLGAAGLWWGLSAGLTVVAVALTARFLVITRRPIARV